MNRAGGSGTVREPSSTSGHNDPASSVGRSKPEDAAGSPVGKPGVGTALPSPIKVPLPTNEVIGKRFDEAVALLRGPIAAACGNGQCVTVKRIANPDFDPVQLTEFTCDRVTTVVDAEGVGETQTVSVERGGSLVLAFAPPCTDIPAAPASDEGEPE
jgi:hypothetical protein